jgi:CheY-like chemotaxis protein
LECSNGFTRRLTIRALEWGWQSANASSNAPEGACGSSPNPAGVQRFSLPFPHEDGAEAGDKRTILLVEDNPADARLVREALEEHSARCELLLVDNGATALEFFEGVDSNAWPCPDLLILDLNLPKVPGAVVLERAVSSPKCKGMPVAVLTSSGDRADKARVAAIGGSRYFRKPSRLAEFLALGGIFKEMLNR